LWGRESSDPKRKISQEAGYKEIPAKILSPQAEKKVEKIRLDSLKRRKGVPLPKDKIFWLGQI
jgi:hypothetical protein